MKDTIFSIGADQLDNFVHSLPKIEVVFFIALGGITIATLVLVCIGCCCARAGFRRGAGLKRERRDTSKKKKRPTDQLPDRELDDLSRKASVTTQRSARDREERLMSTWNM